MIQQTGDAEACVAPTSDTPTGGGARKVGIRRAQLASKASRIPKARNASNAVAQRPSESQRYSSRKLVMTKSRHVIPPAVSCRLAQGVCSGQRERGRERGPFMSFLVPNPPFRYSLRDVNYLFQLATKSHLRISQRSCHLWQVYLALSRC